MSEYTTGYGQVLHFVHPESQCSGRPCVLHAPSDHPMTDLPTYWRSDRSIMERICEHGVGHPDPDDTAYLAALDPNGMHGVHGCDGCCSRNARRRRNKRKS